MVDEEGCSAVIRSLKKIKDKYLGKSVRFGVYDIFRDGILDIIRTTAVGTQKVISNTCSRSSRRNPVGVKLPATNQPISY